MKRRLTFIHGQTVKPGNLNQYTLVHVFRQDTSDFDYANKLLAFDFSRPWYIVQFFSIILLLVTCAVHGGTLCWIRRQVGRSFHERLLPIMVPLA